MVIYRKLHLIGWRLERNLRSNDKSIVPIDVFAQNKEIDKIARRMQNKYEYIIIDVGGQAGRALGASFVV